MLGLQQSLLETFVLSFCRMLDSDWPVFVFMAWPRPSNFNYNLIRTDCLFKTSILVLDARLSRQQQANKHGRAK